MAPFKRKKEALRATSYAYAAGLHYIVSEVGRARALRPDESFGEQAHAELQAEYTYLLTSPQTLDFFVEHLNEENLYPFGPDWSREALSELVAKLIAPQLALTDAEPPRLRFKKGYRHLLNACAEAVESQGRNQELLDHWLTLILNSAFFGALTAAARSASEPKAFYGVLDEIETEIEPWSHYPQLCEILDRQLRRETKRKSGLVTDAELEFEQ